MLIGRYLVIIRSVAE